MNIVLTKSGETFENASAASSLDQALELAKSSDKVFIIGGAQIYQEALDHNECKQIHVTKIFNRFECDTFFLITKNSLNAFMLQIFGSVSQSIAGFLDS